MFAGQLDNTRKSGEGYHGLPVVGGLANMCREFDSSAWTGRKPRFPKLALYFRNRLFMLTIGHDWMVNAYAIRFSAIENKARRDGEYFYKINKVWWLVTATQVVRGYF